MQVAVCAAQRADATPVRGLKLGSQYCQGADAAGVRGMILAIKLGYAKWKLDIQIQQPDRT